MRAASTQRTGRASIGARGQRGQSLVEVAIACLVMVPLFAGVLLLGQYMHVRQATQASTRAAAWDATVSSEVMTPGSLPSKATAQTRMQALQFGTADTQVAHLTAPTKLNDPMLTTFAGRDLVLKDKVVLKTYTNTKSPALDETILASIGKATKAIGLGSFPPDNNGFITAEVHVAPEHLQGSDGRSLKFMDPLDTMDLDFHGRTVLLADAWNAQGSGEDSVGHGSKDVPRSVRAAIRPLVFSEMLGDKFDNMLGSVIGIFGSIPGLNDIWTVHMKSDQFVIGKTAPDVVPADRLTTYGKTK
jgi:Tfp pilus assembly protein PilV